MINRIHALQFKHFKKSLKMSAKNHLRNNHFYTILVKILHRICNENLTVEHILEY